MSKGFKTVALIIVIILLGILMYNIFSGENNANQHTKTISTETDRPFYVSLLISWVPMMVIIIFYICYFNIHYLAFYDFLYSCL